MPVVRIVEQRPVDARCVSRLRMGRSQSAVSTQVCFFLSDALNEVVGNLQIAPVREDDCELILRGLEDAEGRVRGPVDYLDVLTPSLLSASAYVCNGSKAATSPMAAWGGKLQL